MLREGLEKLEHQRKKGGREDFSDTANSRIDQQHRTIFSALLHARSSLQTSNCMLSSVWVGTSPENIGGVNLALVGRGGCARGK